jgi:hypothetical protein
MDDPFVESGFSGLLVKVSAGKGYDAKGKVYLIPEVSLAQFEFEPTNPADFDKLDGIFRNLDYAIFREDFTFRGNAG